MIAFVIGKGLAAAKKLYALVKAQRARIETIYTDANSCYQVAFAQLRIPEKHEIGKDKTHLIESSNSSIRDNLARFMRKSKRHSKTFHMLDHTLKLFFDYKRLEKYYTNTK